MERRLTDPAPRSPAARCLAGGALFVAVFVAAWVLAVVAYGFIVEEWGMIRVRREFGYDWALLYAPLFAIGCATTAAWFGARGVSDMRLTLIVVVAALLALFAAILLFGLGGLF